LINPSRQVLGVGIWDPTYEEFAAWFYEQVEKGVASRFYFANAHTLNLAFEDPAYREALNRADRVVRDGSGIELAGKLLKSRFGYNFNGTDLLPKLLAESQIPIRVFLYGASEKSNLGAQERIAKDFPQVIVTGGIDGFVSQEEAILAIQASQADLLLVALGQPLQELFLDRLGHDLGVKQAVGVGALFDFLSGEVPRAPLWLRKIKMEWFYRFLREPKRMFKRYITGNPKFMWRVVRSRSKSKD